MSTLARAGVDFVITGHSHQYERFRPVRPPRGEEGTCVTYITSAGGGAPLYDIRKTAYHAVAEKVHHFCIFEVAGDKLSMKAIDITGRTIDRFELQKSNGKKDPQYLKDAVPLEAVRLHQLLHNTWPIPLDSVPGKGEKFKVKFRFTVGELPAAAKMTFRLHCNREDYETKDQQTVQLDRKGGEVEVELTTPGLVPLNEGRSKAHGRLLKPPLRVECTYQLGDITETVAGRRVVVQEN